MKPILLLWITLYLAIPFLSLAQDSTIYFNKQWNPCNKDTASYYRHISRSSDGKYSVTDYFLTRNIQMTGTYSSANTLDKDARDGYFVYYDSLGFKSGEGNYATGKRAGKWTEYFKYSGLVKYTADYSTDSSAYFIYYDSAFHNKTAEGARANGKRNGMWKYYYEFSDKVEFSEKYDTGKVIETDVYYDDGIIASRSFPTDFCTDSAYFYDITGKFAGASLVYRKTDKQPRAAVIFKKYFKKHLQYPPKAKAARVEGIVRVLFIVNENGRVSNIITLKHVGGGCDAEAERLVAALPRHIPGKINHKAVKSYCYLDVPFSLKDE